MNELLFAPVEVEPWQILEATNHYAGQPFALDGHYVERDDQGVIHARLDCLRLLFFAWRDCGLWPLSWGGQMPRELRAIRLQWGNDLHTLFEFPVLIAILETNFTEIEPGQRQAGDVLGFRWESQPDVHHTGIASTARLPFGSMWHCPARGVVREIDLDQTFLNRLERVWRLKPVAERGQV